MHVSEAVLVKIVIPIFWPSIFVYDIVEKLIIISLYTYVLLVFVFVILAPGLKIGLYATIVAVIVGTKVTSNVGVRSNVWLSVLYGVSNNVSMSVLSTELYAVWNGVSNNVLIAVSVIDRVLWGVTPVRDRVVSTVLYAVWNNVLITVWYSVLYAVLNNVLNNVL